MNGFYEKYPRERIDCRLTSSLNDGSPRSNGEVIQVPKNKILVVETISVNVRVPNVIPVSEIARLHLIHSGPEPPLVEIPIVKMGIEPLSNFQNYAALVNIRAYATGLIQYALELSCVPSSGRGVIDLSLFGYLIPENSPSFAP